MDTIKYLLQFLFKLAIVVFFVVIVWWGVVAFNPGFSIRTLLLVMTSPNATTSPSSEWLPAPGSFKGLLATPKLQPSAGYGTVFNGFDNGKGEEQYNYVNYEDESQATVDAYMASRVPSSSQKNKAPTTPFHTATFAPKDMYMRSLSLLEGGHIYTGLSFTGEVRSGMFLDGKFPILISETATGRILSVITAKEVKAWSTPGWTRFRASILVLNQSTAKSCTMIFEQARPQGSQFTPIRIAIPVSCN